MTGEKDPKIHNELLYAVPEYISIDGKRMPVTGYMVGRTWIKVSVGCHKLSVPFTSHYLPGNWFIDNTDTRPIRANGHTYEKETLQVTYATAN